MVFFYLAMISELYSMKIAQLYNLFQKSIGVTTDSRKIEKNHLFIALKGENFNGNKFARQAIEKGAIAAVVDEKEFEDKENRIYCVKEGLQTLQDLAHHHRKQLQIPVIALTGSNGKTTTKELISAALSAQYKVTYTQGNLNNHIGVPLTLLTIDKSTEIAVVEMGANHPKEIAELCQIAAPDFGYITNFGKAHLEGFGSEEGVVKAKSELYDFLRETNGKAFVYMDDSKQLKQSQGLEITTFGSTPQADYLYKKRKAEKAEIEFNHQIIASQLIGDYNQTNIAAAAAIASFFNVPLTEIAQQISTYIPANNRSQIVEKNGKKILLDAYNANPTSMEAALLNFKNLNGTKTVILGDMFELGSSSALEHSRMAKLAEESNFEEVYLIGEQFFDISISQAKKFKYREDFISYLKEIDGIKSDYVLIKGSRGMALEKLLPFV